MLISEKTIGYTKIKIILTPRTLLGKTFSTIMASTEYPL